MDKAETFAGGQGTAFKCGKTTGFKQEPKEVSSYSLLAMSELRKRNGQFIRKKHVSHWGEKRKCGKMNDWESRDAGQK